MMNGWSSGFLRYCIKVGYLTVPQASCRVNGDRSIPLEGASSQPYDNCLRQGEEPAFWKASILCRRSLDRQFGSNFWHWHRHLSQAEPYPIVKQQVKKWYKSKIKQRFIVAQKLSVMNYRFILTDYSSTPKVVRKLGMGFDRKEVNVSLPHLHLSL